MMVDTPYPLTIDNDIQKIYTGYGPSYVNFRILPSLPLRIGQQNTERGELIYIPNKKAIYTWLDSQGWVIHHRIDLG